ncbi:MAG: hypothetical protein HKL96_09105 [Phycisphaerales bacterium]|nr:hypothetical protein [Phycisphaerales bacterium]
MDRHSNPTAPLDAAETSALSRRHFLQVGVASAATTTLAGSTGAAHLKQTPPGSGSISNTWNDFALQLEMRAPAGAPGVELWCAVRCVDLQNRYVVALRGAPYNDLYIARYAGEGGIRFLGLAPLGFTPELNTWYALKVFAINRSFHVYLNDETVPRLNTHDAHPLWSGGSIATGGGFLAAEYRKVRVSTPTGQDRATFDRIGSQCWEPSPCDKSALRRRQRAAYKPATVQALTTARSEMPLDGDWLFMPDNGCGDSPPVSLHYDDEPWHVMHVPDFWTPGLSWLYGQNAFGYLRGIARLAGVAESLDIEEAARVNGYTFDWSTTRAAWYRHYVYLPHDLRDRHFELCFDAIAKISEIWVNGVRVGGHTGLFAEQRYDITHAMRGGRNVIAVHVIGEIQAPHPQQNDRGTIAVTVEVTPQMLNSLPHGMLQGNVAGIWQGVRLIVTNPLHIGDCTVQASLHGAHASVALSNSSERSGEGLIKYKIVDAADGSVLHAGDGGTITLSAGTSRRTTFSTPSLQPKVWSPESPHLYYLQIDFYSGGRVIDTYSIRFGFRTFERQGSRLMLNGKPYWLRGANPFPCNLKPNDRKLAATFTKLAHDGNVRAVRTHIVPFTKAWLDAADEIGVCVSYEGIWPWLMMIGEPPRPALLQVWRQEYLALIKKYMNHPSIILWTVNNEMNFGLFDEHKPHLLATKWRILDGMIHDIRRIDPSRPVVAYSGYVRKEARIGYETVVQPNNIDDGDIDDAHRYFGWYNPSFFHLYDGQFGKELFTPGRPLISQEMGTGYPNNDDGHPTRHYLFNHYTPQALVGNDAYENANPTIFLARQAFMTKELAETLRRTGRDTTAGILHFAYFTWFRRPWSAEHVVAAPGYEAMKTSLAPVMVSVELFGRHLYAGRTVSRRVCIVNDSEPPQNLAPGRLVWRLWHGPNLLAQGDASTPPVAYYANHWLNMTFATPAALPAGRVDAVLEVQLMIQGRPVAENRYDLLIATGEWANSPAAAHVRPALLAADEASHALLQHRDFKTITHLNQAHQNQPIVIGAAAAYLAVAQNAGELRAFIAGGGKALLLFPGRSLARLAPGQIGGYKAKDGEIVTIAEPQSPVFEQLRSLDLAWFERGARKVPLACTGVHQIVPRRADVRGLAWQCDLHGYLKKPQDVTKVSGYPLIELRIGHGRLLASEMYLQAGDDDPVARRLLANMLQYLWQA